MEAETNLRHTQIPRQVAWTLIWGFLLLLTSEPIFQITLESLRSQEPFKQKEAGPNPIFPEIIKIWSLRPRINRIPPQDLQQGGSFGIFSKWLATFPPSDELRAFETQLEDHSFLGAKIHPLAQWVLTRLLRAGNQKVCPGKDGWLFYQPDIDYLTNPPFLNESKIGGDVPNNSKTDPVQTIIQFRNQLKDRGIDLMVMPTPVKPSIEPEHLTHLFPLKQFPLQNPSYSHFLECLRKEHIDVLDVSSLIATHKERSLEDQFLKTDTHWTPGAMRLAAGELASWIQRKENLSQKSPVNFISRPFHLNHTGDIAGILKLPNLASLYPPESVEINQVIHPSGELWKSDPMADILILGDSFLNIYSLPNMGWGTSAGFAETLSFLLQRPVDKLAVNAGGADRARHELSKNILRCRDTHQKDLLTTKKLVVLQFSVRDLIFGEWKTFDFPKPSDSPKNSVPPPMPGQIRLPLTDNPDTRTNLSADIEALTGCQTKIVWARSLGHLNELHSSTSPHEELIAFDSREGHVHKLVPDLISCARPWITPDGNHVFYSDTLSNKVWMVDWDGKNRKIFCDGFGLCIQADPVTSVPWIYVSPNLDGTNIYRHPMNHPEVKELVWTGPTSYSFRVSPDGKYSAGEFPHPHVGIARLPNLGWTEYGEGCRSMIAPDNSHRFMHMVGNHKKMRTYDHGGKNMRTINVDPVSSDSSFTVDMPQWSNNSNFLVITALLDPMDHSKAAIFLGKFDQTFTKVTKWLQISDSKDRCISAFAWISPGLGRFVGKVPFQVQLPEKFILNDATIDFGDGTSFSGNTPNGTHVYRAPGTYTLTVRKKNVQLTGEVEAKPHTIPNITDIQFLNSRQLSIHFDEPIQTKNPRFQLYSGVEIESWAVAADEMKLHVSSKRDIPTNDKLTLDGIFDQSTPPIPLTQKTITLSPTPWPVDRNGLIYLWKTRTSRNSFSPGASNSKTSKLQLIEPMLDPHGLTTFDQNGVMNLSGGYFINNEQYAALSTWLAVKCLEKNELSFELVIQPKNLAQGLNNESSPILCVSGNDKGHEGFWLGQLNEHLIFNSKMRTQDGGESPLQVDLCALPDANAHHVFVSYKVNHLVCHLDGKVVYDNTTINKLFHWNAMRHLIFGQNKLRPDAQPWIGKIEGVAIYNRFVSHEEAAKAASLSMQQISSRETLVQIEIDGTLLKKSKSPRPIEIAPYRNALCVCEYKVQKVIEGIYPYSKIRIAHWGVYDGKETALMDFELNQTKRMKLDRFEDHPEKASEYLIDQLDPDHNLPLFIETDTLKSLH